MYKIIFKFIEIATMSVEFSFDSMIYMQIDGIAMNSPLGSVTINIFVRFYEQDLYACLENLQWHFLYILEWGAVWGSPWNLWAGLASSYSQFSVLLLICEWHFCLFDSEEQPDVFHGLLNELYPAFRFTCKKEDNAVLPFLDVQVYRVDCLSDFCVP